MLDTTPLTHSSTNGAATNAKPSILETFDLGREALLKDYRMAWESRHLSYFGRKEVFAGKAKFGIFGDGKELPQLAMAKVFQPGDFRSGYYRDQTFMFAVGGFTYEDFFAQLYANTDPHFADPCSQGRLMNGHFGTRLLNDQGLWRSHVDQYNSAADVSPTASQMPRLLGLAWASKLYRHNRELEQFRDFSNHGNEIAFGTIGDASTSEGMFFETLNAACVMQVPMLISVWDDEYGISVDKSYHTARSSISKALDGFRRSQPGERGLEIFKARAWDYEGLLQAYYEAAKLSREEHVPTLVHVTEVTQQQGHSTSGSHERYKSKERLNWEKENDCNLQFREYLLYKGIATQQELDQIEKEAKGAAKQARKNAWQAFQDDLRPHSEKALGLLDEAIAEGSEAEKLQPIRDELAGNDHPIRQDALKTLKKALRVLRFSNALPKQKMLKAFEEMREENAERYNSHLYSASPRAVRYVPEIKARYSDNPQMLDGRHILNACFEHLFQRDPRVVAFGEDVGKIGDVNQGMAGLQDKFGELRITDTSIRETTIIGQGIGLAMRGLRPIAEIQYLDYLLYAIQILSDDLASLQYRTAGGQKAPLIVRTRGHRLEGVWHAGSPMGVIIHALRGMHVVVPRDMTQAAGFYNTLMLADEPALVVECLNGYRLKEPMPENIGEFTVPLGVPEVVREGRDLTFVTYGSMVRIAEKAADQLEEVGIDIEIVDVQTLLPFDVNHQIVESIKKTNRAIFADEDIPGGASAYMMQEVTEKQGAYRYLDSQPTTLSSHPHRTAYASDGDYFTKPNVEDVFDVCYQMMSEADPKQFPMPYPVDVSL